MTQPQRLPADPQVNMALGQLITNEVLDRKILDAMIAIPRGACVPARLANAACVDEDLPLENGRYFLSPLTFARLVQLADISPNDRVLDIGCAYGYSTAVLAQLAGQVMACELQADMVEHSSRLLRENGLGNARVTQVANLADGYGGDAPYDVILINGAIERVPQQLMSLLREGGRLVAVERKRGYVGLTDGPGILAEYIKTASVPARRVTQDASAPLLPGFALHKGFVF